MNSRPTSATSQYVNLLGVVGFLVTLYALRDAGMERATFTLACMAGTAAPMILVDLLVHKVHRRRSSGLEWDRPPTRDGKRVIVKLLGFYGTIIWLAGLYLQFTEYEHSRYKPFWDVLDVALPPVLLGAIPYFIWIDGRMRAPEDGYYQAGRLITGRFKGLDWDKLGHHVLGWIIKGFYLPLMIPNFGGSARSFASYDWARATANWPSFINFISKFSLAVDLAFVAIGYTLTLRLIDSHIRSPNRVAWGWAATLVLYVPFWGPISSRFFKYGDGLNWNHFFADVPWLFGLWGVLIILSKLAWAWANLSFGCRFSNLTHRGIITNGPYRWTKHPSYVSKNISWWLIYVPFLVKEGSDMALHNVIAILGVNALYYTRARAEERHLSEDPDYVDYALWMNEHSVFAWLGRKIPFFRYVPPPDAPASSGAAAGGGEVG